MNVGSDARICWTAPYDSGSPITSYRIYFKTADNSYSEELNACNGADAQVISDLCCTVPLATFKEAPFNLFAGDHIYAKASAINDYGESVSSQVGDGASLVVVPDSPVNLENDPSQTDSTKIGFTWAPGSSNGGAAIEDY